MKKVLVVLWFISYFFMFAVTFILITAEHTNATIPDLFKTIQLVSLILYVVLSVIVGWKKVYVIGSVAIIICVGIGWYVWNTIEVPYKNRNNEVILTFSETDEMDVVYIGNSLLGVPKVPSKVAEIGADYGYTINYYYGISNGVFLPEALLKIKNSEKLQQTLLDAEVVILQGNEGKQTYDAIKGILQFCREDAQVYYYTTDFDMDKELLKQVANDERVHLIPTLKLNEYAINILGYDKADDLRVKGDFHPSQTNGYISALMTFCLITGNDSVDYQVTEEDDFFQCLKGKTVEQKQKCFQKLCNRIDYLNEYYENSLKDR